MLHGIALVLLSLSALESGFAPYGGLAVVLSSLFLLGLLTQTTMWYRTMMWRLAERSKKENDQ